MKITQITFTSRMGLPSYSHEEIVAVAMISEGKDSVEQMSELKSQVNSILYGSNTPPVFTKTVVENTVTVVDKAPVVLEASSPSSSASAVSETTAAPKSKGTRKNVVEVKEDGTVTGQIANEPEAKLNLPVKETAKPAPAKEDKSIEKYDRTVKEHTSTFAGFLTKTYGDTWKTKEGVKAFSESLAGLEFRDTKTGLLVPSFKSKIEDFFGSSDNVL